MKRLALFASVLALIVAGCSNAEDPGDEGTGSEQSGGNGTVSFEELDEPYDLRLTAPEGFVEADPVREPVLAEDQQTWTFALEGGHADSLLTVTSYVLPEDAVAGDFASQTELILAYEAPMGNTQDPANFYESLVNRYVGVHRYFKSEKTDDGSIFMRNFFMFAGRHVIQLTCQWRLDYDAVTQGCQSLAQDFPYPAGWPVSAPA